MFVAQRKEIGALPDRAGIGLIVHTQWVQVSPLDQVARAIQQRRAAQAIDLAADQLVPAFTFLPDAVIPKIDRIYSSRWLGDHWVVGMLAPDQQAIVAGRQAW